MSVAKLSHCSIVPEVPEVNLVYDSKYHTVIHFICGLGGVRRVLKFSIFLQLGSTERADTP